MAAGAFVIITGVRNPGGTRIVPEALQEQCTVQVSEIMKYPLNVIMSQLPAPPTQCFLLTPAVPATPVFLTRGALWRRTRHHTVMPYLSRLSYPYPILPP